MQLPLEQCGVWARACPGVGQGKSFCVSVCCRGWSLCLARPASAHRNAPYPPSFPARWHSLCVSWWRVRHLTAVCEPCCADHHINRPRCVARTRGPCGAPASRQCMLPWVLWLQIVCFFVSLFPLGCVIPAQAVLQAHHALRLLLLSFHPS